MLAVTCFAPFKSIGLEVSIGRLECIIACTLPAGQ